MKSTLVKSLTIALILSISMFAWTSYAAKENPTAAKWEYKIAYTASEDELHRLGREDWELVSTYAGSTSGSISTPYCVFKRAR